MTINGELKSYAIQVTPVFSYYHVNPYYSKAIFIIMYCLYFLIIMYFLFDLIFYRVSFLLELGKYQLNLIRLILLD